MLNKELYEGGIIFFKEVKMKKSPFAKDCKYDYENKCDCSEDDKCGCDYPNNMEHGYSKECFDDEITLENLEILQNDFCMIKKVKAKKNSLFVE